MKLKRKLPMDEVKRLLEAGVYIRTISTLTGYSISEVSHFAKAWGLQRKQGRRKEGKAVPRGQ